MPSFSWIMMSFVIMNFAVNCQNHDNSQTHRNMAIELLRLRIQCIMFNKFVCLKKWVPSFPYLNFRQVM